jgi:hypothetical protein
MCSKAEIFSHATSVECRYLVAFLFSLFFPFFFVRARSSMMSRTNNRRDDETIDPFAMVGSSPSSAGAKPGSVPPPPNYSIMAKSESALTTFRNTVTKTDADIIALIKTSGVLLREVAEFTYPNVTLTAKGARVALADEVIGGINCVLDVLFRASRELEKRNADMTATMHTLSVQESPRSPPFQHVNYSMPYATPSKTTPKKGDVDESESESDSEVVAPQKTAPKKTAPKKAVTAKKLAPTTPKKTAPKKAIETEEEESEDEVSESSSSEEEVKVVKPGAKKATARK